MFYTQMQVAKRPFLANQGLRQCFESTGNWDNLASAENENPYWDFL